MTDSTVSEILTRAIDSMTAVMTNVQLMRISIAPYIDNSNVPDVIKKTPKLNSEVITPSSSSYQPSSPTASSSPDEPESASICHGLQSAISQFQRDRIDSSRIFVVRKVHCLVNDTAEILSSYFSRFGRVTHVELLPSRRRCGRLRPSTTGFIILDNPEAVSRVLLTSLVHQVTAENSVEVTPFTYPNSLNAGYSSCST